MGNCQAAEAATVVIMHPGNKIERIYWSVSARHVMNSNPGHFVAVVVTSPGVKSDNGMPVRQLKLLRPNDTLLIGKVYRLIRLEDILKEFAAKKCLKLGKLLTERGVVVLETKGLAGAPTKEPITSSVKVGFELQRRCVKASNIVEFCEKSAVNLVSFIAWHFPGFCDHSVQRSPNILVQKRSNVCC